MRSMVCALFLLVYATSSSARCLARVEPVGDDTIAYRQREGRCEGLYREPTAGSINLRLIGYHAGYSKQPIPKGSLRIHVLGEDRPQTTTLRAVGARPRLYYAMDTKNLAPDGRFVWPTDVITHPSIALQPLELAILACSNDCANSEETQYWPVHVGDIVAGQELPLYVVLQASVPIKEVFLTVSEGGGRLRDEESVGDGYYPLERPIFIALGELPAAKVRLDVVVVSESGTSDHLAATLVAPAF